jgi:hypothetical protein
LGVGFERCEDKDEKSDPRFVPTSNYHKAEETIKSTKTRYPSNAKPSFNPMRGVKKETPKPREEAFVCMFLAMLVTWMRFGSGTRELRRGTLIILETHIMMSSLIFRLVLTLMLRLTVLLMLCVISFMDLIIAHIILIHKRTTLCLDALVMAHALIVVIVSRMGMVFLLEGLTLTLSPDTWTVHIFPIVVHVPLVQTVRCKRL